MFKPNTKFEILTPDGFKKFDGVKKTTKGECIELTFDNGISLVCTLDHPILMTGGFVPAYTILSGDTVIADTGHVTVTKVEPLTTQEEFYDAINVEGNQYFTNGIVSHNCVFLSSDALLIKTTVLQEITDILRTVKPKFVIDNCVIFWDDVKPGHTYLVGVDPATGSGSDFTVISVFEFPSLRQIAEYRSNTMSTNVAYGILKKILLYLEKKDTTTYFSVENNGVGEGIISLFEADDDQPLNVEFVSETGRNRRGMTTVSRTKMRACVNLREMIERKVMHIRSPLLLKELKSFTRKRGSYDHQPGSTSDCISATLIIIRMIEEIASYDQQAFDKLYAAGSDTGEWSEDDVETYDENDQPLPMTF